MSRPRRAYKLWWWPKWLYTTTVLLAVALIALVTIYIAKLPSEEAPRQTMVVPQPGPTWTTYVPEMPWECQYMLEAADTLYDTAHTSEQATLKAAVLASEGARENNAGKLIEAGRAIDEAEKWTKQLTKARAKFLAQYRKCAAK